jgi:type II secretory ATPase GspE/PulE/Tfp pilus assembly ATPase PilB-like protein
VGCRECRGTGFFGRHALFEWMDVDEAMRTLILDRASTDQIRNAARAAGMQTLAEDGWRLVAQGLTTVEEILSVTTDKESTPASPAETPEAATTAAESEATPTA